MAYRPTRREFGITAGAATLLAKRRQWVLPPCH